MIDIRIAEPIPTRPCHFMLGMQDDCVFADFDIDENGCLYLVRISYDGYGCCSLNQISKLEKSIKKNLLSSSTKLRHGN